MDTKPTSHCRVVSIRWIEGISSSLQLQQFPHFLDGVAMHDCKSVAESAHTNEKRLADSMDWTRIRRAGK